MTAKRPPLWTGTIYREPLAERIAQAKREVAEQRAMITRCATCGQSGPRGMDWATTHYLKTRHSLFSSRRSLTATAASR